MSYFSSQYHIGDAYKAHYTLAPVDQQYAIGSIVTIRDHETQLILGTFRVTGSNEYEVVGVIEQVFDPPQPAPL